MTGLLMWNLCFVSHVLQPISWIPLAGSAGYRIMTCDPNQVNSDTNSIFGPPEFMCPGNIVTFDIVKAILAVRDQLYLKVVGNEKPKIVQAGVMPLITNSSKVRVVLTRK